jgi:Ca2+-binding RTX toxin-like protein
LSGGAGDDRLYGGWGMDQFRGGSGKDCFVFYSTPTEANIDTIRDFSVAIDTIWLQNSVFKGIGSAGHLKLGIFRTSDEARDATDRIIYDRDDGILYYDADGTSATEQVAFAKLSAGLRITSSDFHII